MVPCTCDSVLSTQQNTHTHTPYTPPHTHTNPLLGGIRVRNEYASSVMMSYHNASTPTSGSWLQTNQPEHESDDCGGDTVTSVCVTNEKDMALQQQIWSTFVTVIVVQ